MTKPSILNAELTNTSLNPNCNFISNYGSSLEWRADTNDIAVHCFNIVAVDTEPAFYIERQSFRTDPRKFAFHHSC